MQATSRPNSKSALNITLGYLFLGSVGVVDSLGDIWFASNYGHGMVMLEALGLLLMGLGLLAYLNDQAWDSALFIVGGLGAWTYQASVKLAVQGASGLQLSLPPGEPLSYQGWYFFFLAVFFGALTLPASRISRLRRIFVLAKTAQFALAAVACWFGIAFLQPVTGYIGVAAAPIATVIGALALTSFANSRETPSLSDAG